MRFEYKIGDIVTNTRWERPNKGLLYKWYQKFLQIPGVEKYEIYVGSALFKIKNTWDVDIILLGEIKDYNEFKNILDQSMILGFENRQLIDIFHSNQLWYFSEEWKETTKIRNWKNLSKEINGNIVSTKNLANSEELIPGLYKRTYTKPSNSYLWGKEKFNKGEYNENYIALKDIFKI